jgi:hypothetical protein
MYFDKMKVKGEVFMTTKSIRRRKNGASPTPKKARITVECSLELRRVIRILAAQNDQSMNDFILSLVEKEQNACYFCENYGPSKKTINAIEQIEKGKNIEQHSSPEAFWESFYKEENDSSN